MKIKRRKRLIGNDTAPRRFIKSAALLWLVPGLAFSSRVNAASLQNPPGTYTTSWLGNSFGGGDGQWVQDAARKIAVSPDGVIIAGAPYDEGGRCVGFYKAGKANVNLLKENHPSKVWGWGTGSAGVAVSGGYIYDATSGGRNGSVHQLLTFHWTPGDIDSAVNVDPAINLPNSPTGLSASGNLLAVVYPGAVEVRNTYNIDSSLGVIRSFPVGDSTHIAYDVAIAPDRSFWVLAGSAVTHYSADGRDLGVTVPSLADPVAVAFDNQGRLMVCDDATDQVKFFSLTGTAPVLAATFGTPGGLLAGVPGALAPGKLYDLVGAGADSVGNIYVAMSFDNQPSQPFASAGGNLYLYSYFSSGILNWSLFSGSYINNFGFDPSSDGQTVYSATGIYRLDLDNTAPGSEQSLQDITLDTRSYPADPRGIHPESVLVRHPAGRIALYGIGQHGGGFKIYGFTTPNSNIASPLASIGATGWAWDVDANAGVWNGDARGNIIDYFPLQKWEENVPLYNTASPTVYQWPAGWRSVQRIKYVAATDTMYIAGYRADRPPPKGWWWLIGYALGRYDGWMHGGRTLAWLNPSLPLDKSSYPPKCLDVAGDYIFMAGVYAAYNAGPQAVHILSARTGAYVGAFQPGPSVGQAGNVDSPFAVAAVQRANGEYLVMVEEDYRAKQILYRWKP